MNDTPIRYGSFLTALLTFVIVAISMFLVVKAANRLQRKGEPTKESETELLKQIRDELRARTPTHA